MRINPTKFALAGAITTAIIWVVCSILVFAMPSPMMNMSGHMVHANLGDMNWTLSLTGFVVGLISWSLSVGIFGWILAYIYNTLIKE
jgi:H+/Cl- antiporter ClcA